MTVRKAGPKARAGRGRFAELPITARPDEVENYARFGATDPEIAALLGCSPDTLVRRFGVQLVQGRVDRKIKLREKQYAVAMEGNVTMLIWLGKQELGQTDKQITQHEFRDIPKLSDAELAAQAKALGLDGS